MRVKLFAIFFLCSLLLPYSYMRPPWGYNQATRLDVLHAVFTEGRIAIDSFHENTGDKIEWNDHFYSDKAPGVSVIAAPAFFGMHTLLRVLDINTNDDLGWKISEWVTTTFSVGFLAILSAVFLFQLLKQYVDPRVAYITIIAVYLGTVLYTYGVMLFSHTATAALIIIALWALHRPSQSWRYTFLAGALLGLAIAGEYTAALSAGAIGIYVLLRNKKRGVYLAAGAVFPLLLIPLNNWLISGALLSLPYEHVTDFPGMKEGFFGLHLVPDITVMWKLLGSQYRGLFFWSPFLLLCIPGFFVLRKHDKHFFWLSLLTPIASVILISSYSYWHGGWALGPRHLASIVPFLIIPAALGCNTYRKLGHGLAVLSMTLTGLGTLLKPLIPEGNTSPITDVYWPMIKTGDIRENIGMFIGLEGWMSVAPLIAATVLCIGFAYYLAIPKQ